MWGDPERASRLEPSDALATLLLQVTGPAHIPWNDPRWQELLHGYDVWVHLESCDAASQSMAKHAATSSNLAALSLHVARMLKDLVASCNNKEDEAFTRTIALVGKARATAGALNLLLVLVHPVVTMQQEESLNQVFTYRNRDITEKHRADRMAGHDLLHASFMFLTNMACQNSMDDATSTTTEAPWTAVPELYDATNKCLQLVLVLLSTQLYQPMVSSSQQRSNSPQENYFLDYCMAEAQKRRQQHQQNDLTYDSSLGEPLQTQRTAIDWTPQSVLQACLSWQLARPNAPERSIAYHHAELAQSVVHTKERKVGPDGMYESHVVVMASKPKEHVASPAKTKSSADLMPYGRPPSRVILDATRGVLVLSSSLIMLPFRLMSLAFNLWGHKDADYDALRKQHMQSTVERRRTNDVLWLSNSPVADLGSCLLLLLAHNCRADNEKDSFLNPFRAELAALGDSRWEAGGLDNAVGDTLDSLASDGAQESQFDSFVNQEEPSALSKPLLNKSNSVVSRHHLTTNFESLFESFGDILHTELGALLLYTTLQSSPMFASFIVVRSDLDTLVMPLLRTLYFSSALTHYSPHGMVKSSSSPGNVESSALALKSCPFRSPSQLYVIMILLLLFSQDASFGPDAFRRVMVSSVPWYKERNLKDINLGSVLLLTLLRSITFNLSKLHDAFLLSNCCAVLMNLSHNVVNLHEYAAMRLASVTMSVLKRYAVLAAKSNGKGQHDDITTPLGMYAEVSHTLLRLLRHCMSSKNIDRNLHLVYALVYHQVDFNQIASNKTCPVKKSELSRVHSVITTASTLIQEDGDARTAPKAMSVLETHMNELKQAVSETTRDDTGDFTFTYEEEADPEIFFIPYVWEVIVCVATASSIEWNKNSIQVFQLLEEEEEEENTAGPTAGFSQDVADVV